MKEIKSFHYGRGSLSSLPPDKPRIILILFMLASILMSSVRTQSGFQSVTVTTNPTTVGFTPAKLTFTTSITASTGFFNTGDIISFNVPQPGQFTANSAATCVSKTSSITVTACSISLQVVSVTISTTASVNKFQVEVPGFKNPNSDTQISGISTTLISSAGQTRATHISAVLANLQPDQMTAASIKTMSDFIGDESASIEISLTPKNILKSNGKIIVYFPPWNPDDNRPDHYISTTTPNCASVSGMSSFMSCSYSRDTRKLTVTKPVDSDITKTSVTFSVDSFRNPYSGKPRTGFYIATTDSADGQIDSSSSNIVISIQTSTWASISADIGRGDDITTVGELSIGSLYFALPFPVDSNCRLELIFPTDMPITNDLSEISSSGIISVDNVAPTSKNIATNSFYIDGCSTYSSTSAAVLIMSMYDFKNKGYLQDTSTFTLKLWALSGSTPYPIALQDQGLIFAASKFTVGSIAFFAVSASPTGSSEIQKFTTYQVTVKPSHDMKTDSQLTVKFPSSITLVSGTCQITSPVSPMSSTGSTCSVSNNILTVTNPFGSSGSYTAGGAALSFIFSTGGTNPLSVKDAGEFIVSANQLVNGVGYLIDQTTFPNGIYTPTPSLLSATVSSVSSYEAYYKPSIYTLSIAPNKQIPQGALMTIQYPNEVYLDGLAVPSCTYTIDGKTKESTTIITLQTSPTIIRIEDAFTDAAYTQVTIPFQISCKGFQNPRTTKVTSSFQIYTYDLDNYALESGTSGITVQMKTTPNLSTFSVSAASKVNGFANSYTIYLMSPLPHADGDAVYFQVPPEITLPTTATCTATGSLQAVSCVKDTTSPDIVKATLTFVGGQNIANAAFQFLLNNVQNPPDTRQSSSFQNVKILDNTGLQLTQYSGSVYLKNTDFATITTRSLTQSKLGLQDVADYSITYTAVNRMPSGSAFKIGYSSTKIILSNTISTCKVTYKTVEYTMNSCSVDLTNKIISVSSSAGTGFLSAVAAGDSITITFGQVTNPITQTNPGTLTLQSFTDSTFQYYIDEAKTGLPIAFECDYPCRTCNSPTSKTQCLSCQKNIPTETRIYLSNQQCLTSCPDGFYPDSDLICQACSTNCKTCSSFDYCTSCVSTSDFPYLNSVGKCVQSCDTGKCPLNYVCSDCNAPKFTALTVAASVYTVMVVSQLTFIATIDPKLAYYATDDVISFLVPQPGKFAVSTTACSVTTSGVTIQSCLVTNQMATVKLRFSSSTVSSITVRISGFTNPPTTLPITQVQAYLVDSKGDAKAVSQDATLSGFTPEKIQTATLSINNPVVGATGVTLTASIVLGNIFKTSYLIKFAIPLWNPTTSSISTSSPICKGVSSNISPSITCSYDSNLQILTLKNCVTTDVSEGDILSFSVDSFINPYNGKDKTNFQIITYEQTGIGMVDRTDSLSVTATEFATLDSLTISRADSVKTVGEQSSLTFGFSLNLPADSNCVLRIIFPDDMPLDDKMKNGIGSNIFASSLVADNQQAKKYVEFPGCSTYIDASVMNQPSTITGQFVLNKGWVADTSPFIYQLYAKDSDGKYYKIAQGTNPTLIITTDITDYTKSMLEPGSLSYFKLEAVDTSAVGYSTTFKVTFTPIHSIPTANQIQIKFPPTSDGIVLKDDDPDTNPCSITSTTSSMSPQATCSIDTTTNSLIITNAFGASGTYVRGISAALSFIFSTGGTNPGKACDPGNYIVQTFAIVGGQNKPIDYKEFSKTDPTSVFVPYIATPAVLVAGVNQPSSTFASKKGVSYSFKITPQSSIPQFSSVAFQFPPTVTLQSGLTQVSCTSDLTGSSVLTATPTSTSPLKFSLTTIFNSNGFTADGSASFQVTCQNLVNPRNLISTSSFTVAIADQAGCAIAAISTGLSVQMTSVPDFQAITVASDNVVNGGTAGYTISVTPDFDMITGDIFFITFPSDITLPSSPSCSGVTLMASSLTCSSPSTNKLQITLTFTTSPVTQGTKFAFKVSGIKNPPSTEPTDPFTAIEAQDTSKNQIGVFTGTGPVISNKSPAAASGTLEQYDKGVSVPTDYTITYTNVNRLPAGAAFQVTYPSNVGVPSVFQSCQATVASVAYIYTCTVETSSRTIKMTGSQMIPVSVGQKIAIKLSALTNPGTQLSPQTLTMTSFTDSTFSYKIDQISSGLIPQYKCDYPCASCPTQTTRTTCLSCFITEPSVPEKYLNGTKCLSACPDGFYNDNYICKKCPTECKTCKNANTCVTCDTSTTSQYQYFNNSWCYSKCPDTFYGDSSFQCQKCDSNCLTCSGSATNCTSCVQSSDFALLSKSQCVSKCDAGWVSINFICQPCKAPCGTCVATVDQCTSCKTGNLLGTKCLDTCPSGYTTDNKKCIGCDPKCDQCSPTQATKCLQCLKPLVLLNNTCISKCPDGYRVDSAGINCLQISGGGGSGGTDSGGSGSGSGSGSAESYIDKNNKTYAYFTTQIAQVVLGGVAVGSRFKDPSSSWHSNTVGLWGPVEMISVGGQVYLSYDQLSQYEKLNGTNATEITTNSTAKRMLLEVTQALTQATNDIVPLVFYGTAFSFCVKILCNFIFCLFFLMILRKDAGYQEFAQVHKCHPWSVVIFSTLFSFKMHKFLYSRFMGLDRFYIPFENPEKIHAFFNVLTTLNIILSLVPIILIDVYGLAKYKWGNQFYVMMIETLIFSLTMILVQVFEYRAHKNFNPYLDDYSQVKDNSKEIEDEVRRRLGEALDDYARRLKAERDGEKQIRRTKSMCDIGDRDKEEDPRYVNTEPLDRKKKKEYEDRLNPYHQVLDHDFPDNVYAEVGRNLKSPDGYGIGKIQQTGQRVMSEDEYDRELDSRARMQNTANMRGDQRLYGKMADGEIDDEFPTGYKKKKNMRGRKGKYYSQVDDEDQTFLEQERRLIDGGIEEDDDDELDDERLGMIEEESNHSTQRKQSEEDTKLLSKTTPRGPQQQQINKQTTPKGANNVTKQPSPRDLQQLENQIMKESVSPRVPPQAIPEEENEHEEIPLTNRSKKPIIQVHQEDERDLDEDDILDDKEVVMNQRLKSQSKDNLLLQPKPDIDGTFAKFKTTEDMRKEIEKMSKKLEEENQIIEQQNEDGTTSGAESGQQDSDDDEQHRVQGIRDAEKRKFNVNDILGEFDRDERGHPLILQDKKGELIDKDGNRVNEKGYLVDPKTGDVVEREQRRKVFSAAELDDKGELPPPFNLERYNFNGHDVRGYFDRDANHQDILKNFKRDKQGFFVDKLGRRVNEHGFLIDMYGNLTDKRLRTKLHKHIMEQNGGDIPQLFTYKGKKFDLMDVLGTLDKDRKGNIIIRRDAKGKMVDKQGRLVNAKGYLCDQDGNVVNSDGKVLFENYTLSKDGEIPKLFSFLKFNIDEVRGDYEMDPLGNPMLQKNKQGQLVDSKGRRVNSKGYLLDENGNVVNKKNHKVFGKKLLEEDGEVPKVFRAGLLRKDTYDSFSQLMSEIEDLERLQEMEENAQGADPRLQEKIKRRMEKENDRLQKKIDKIVEGEDDEGMLMKELEELANGGNNGQPEGRTGRLSDGGNTSVDSMMEDTPSNYNALNQRFMEVEAVKAQAKRNLRAQQQVPEGEEDDEEVSEYSYMPDRKMRKKKKKKKKKKRAADGTVDERELMMARAYGGLSQSQYDKLVALKKLQASQLPPAARVDTSHLMQRTPSTIQQQMFARGQHNNTIDQQDTIQNRFNEDQGSDWERANNVEGGGTSQMYNRKTAGQSQSVSRQRQQHQGNSTSRIVVANKPMYKNNNLMVGSTQKSMAGDGSELSEEQKNMMMGNQLPQFNRNRGSKKNIEQQQQRLADVANSVSGFYKDHGPAMSEHGSNMSRTQDNFASNLAGNQRRSSAIHDNNGSPRGDQPGQQRIYGTANRGQKSRGHMGGPGPDGGFGDDFSEDWERQSHRSGRSQMSQFSQVNAMKVKGLETIYLQRLEPAAKGNKKGGASKRGAPHGSEKAKFRVMHHKFHDEPEWHVEDRDELDSIISGNYKEMQKKFEEEFQGSSHGTRSRGKSNKRIVQQKSSGNVFSGNLKAYKK